ncbi:MAG: DNA polymerase III subunit gamma/tau [Sodalis sp. (in: enterobacteria)]
MSYQVLARKWRPQTFTDVVGQEHVLTALKNGISLGRIHHAYLLSGTRGVGKTTIARLLAKGLNCETGITSIPCTKCDNCREIEQGRFVDLIEIDAASHTKVEDTRELLDNAQYAPARGRFKVYLIDEVHMLSRYSFNALLKTLEEPPGHIKFLLATTDPQKLPVTILSRCLQFHLKVLNVEQIRNQLSSVLQQEQIVTEVRALQLLANAADGSMRDAFSLTDQAIAMGQGEVRTKTVSLMLGTLNIEQPLALIEALVNANGSAMMAQLAQCAARGIDWESLLVEMLSLLHRLALAQLVPDQLNDEDDPTNILRLRALAQSLPPADLQLYYQTLLIGRKELPFAPNSRMGVEMTLLRALAFHPAIVETVINTASTEKKTDKFSNNRRKDSTPIRAITAASAPNASAAMLTPARFTLYDSRQTSVNAIAAAQSVPESLSFSDSVNDCRINNEEESLIQAYIASDFDDKAQSERQDGWLTPKKDLSQASSFRSFSKENDPLPDATAKLLQARNTLLKHRESKKTKKGKLALARQKTTDNALLQPASRSGHIQQHQQSAASRENLPKAPRLEMDRWRGSQQSEAAPEKPVTTPKSLHTALGYEKTPELVFGLAEELLTRNPWAAQINCLAMPRMAQQLALNTWKEDLAPSKVCLHLRTSQRHLNSAAAQSALCAALSAGLGEPVELTIIEDDNPAIKTPLEWQQTIYEEKLIQAREAIMNDAHIQMLQCFFDAKLDENSIQPV